MGDDPAAKARALAAKFSAKLGGGPIVLGGYVASSAQPQPFVGSGGNDTVLGKRIRSGGDDADGAGGEKEQRRDDQQLVAQDGSNQQLSVSHFQSPLSREPEKANPNTFSLSSALYANDQGFTMSGSRVPFEVEQQRAAAGAPPLRGPLRAGEQAKDIEVNQEHVGLVIGRAGDTIKAIQSLTGVYIAVAKEAPPDGRPIRVLTLKGTDAQIAAGEVEVRRVCNGGRVGVEGSEGSVGGGGGGGDRGPPRMGGPGLGYGGGGGGDESVQVPAPCVGLVIGRGGETIRGIQDRTGAMVQVQKDDGSGGQMRTIKLIGSPDAIARARQEIEGIVSNTREAGGPGLGGGPPRGGGYGGYGGPPGGGYGGPGVPGMDGGGPPGAGGPGGYGGGGHGGHGGPSTTTVVQVPNSSTGLIIGRGGEIVKRLQQITGARIQISRDEGAELRDVLVSGRPEQCEHARSEILQLVQQREGGGGPVDVRQLGGGAGGPPPGAYGGPPPHGGGGYGGYGRGPPPQQYGGGGYQGGYGGPPPHQQPYGSAPYHQGGPPPQQPGYGPPPGSDPYGAPGAAPPASSQNGPPSSSSQQQQPPQQAGEEEAPAPPSDPNEFASWWPTLTVGQQMAYYKKYNPELYAQYAPAQ